MAASLSGDTSSTGENTQASELRCVKDTLQAYSGIVLPLNRILEWEQPYYPAAIVGGLTFVFAIVWYLEPSVLTTFSVIGLIVCLADFVMPFVSGYLFGKAELTPEQQKQYDNICQRILNAKAHVISLQNQLLALKNSNPRVYLLVMMGVFAALAWVGSLIDNLLLTFVLVVFTVLLPGLRKHHILQKAMARVNDVIKKTADKGAAKAKVN